MSLETPVIATRIRGTRELLRRGGGLLVELGNLDELARAMHWIADHRCEARALGREARQAVFPYSLERVLQLHDALYERALAGR